MISYKNYIVIRQIKKQITGALIVASGMNHSVHFLVQNFFKEFV